jgi:hypothetical protein
MSRLTFFAILFAIPSAFAADWPQFRGPKGDGVSSETNLPTKWSDTEGVAWKTKLPGPGTSSPIAFGDRIYLTCYSGYNVPSQDKGDPEDLKRHLLCLDRKTGEIKWDTPTKAKLPEQESIRDGHGYASSTPAADADRVYCFYGKSGVFAFDHKGKQQWTTDVGDGLNGWGSASSPVLHGDLVFVNASVESDTLYALDKKTGEEKWKATGIKESWSTPVVAKSKEGREELLVPIQGKILAYDPANGERLPRQSSVLDERRPRHGLLRRSRDRKDRVRGARPARRTGVCVSAIGGREGLLPLPRRQGQHRRRQTRLRTAGDEHPPRPQPFPCVARRPRRPVVDSVGSVPVLHRERLNPVEFRSTAIRHSNPRPLARRRIHCRNAWAK